jgi:signal transduction histidine kinase
VRAAEVRTPIVVLTGFGDEQTVVDVMKAGATDYLAKGAVSPERIAQVVRAAIRLGAAEELAAAARAAQERYAAQLRGLTDAAVAMSAAENVDDLLRVAATHACRITGAVAAAITLAGDVAIDLGAPTEAAWTSPEGAPTPQPSDATPVERVPLPGRAGGLLGEIALAGHAAIVAEHGVVGQLARLVAGAVENMRLYLAAQRASREREDVLAIVSHDLRNPLHTIGLSASLLAELMPESLPPAILEQSNIIRRAVDRANRLIQDLLDVARAEGGGMTLTTESVPPRAILDEAMDSMRPTTEAAGITLTCHADAELPNVRADRERLAQVFTNLVSNAARFTPRGGEIAIGAACAGADSGAGDGAGDGAAVRFTVRDTGSGIPPENLPHLFDRFWQARTSARTGAGLGLAIVKGIVEAHGGEVTVTSEPGKGTEFAFTIPAAR